MSDPITSATITSVFSLIVAVVGGMVSLLVAGIVYFQTQRQIAAEREKTQRQIVAEREKLERELERKFTERLYDARLQEYIRAFEITEPLGKNKGIDPAAIQAKHNTIREELRQWKAGRVNLIISDAVQDAFYEMENLLKKNPEKGNTYSDTQLDNIWQARNHLRGALRRDLGLLFREEES